MPRGAPAVKKSVTIERAVLSALAPIRKRNFSRTVNDSLRLTAALDRQRQLVAEFEREHGVITEAELRPHLEVVIRAQVEANLRQHKPVD